MSVKEISTKKLIHNIIIKNSVYFIFLSLFLLSVLKGNLDNEKYGSSFSLIMFLGMIITYLCCFYELRMVKQNGEYFMPKAKNFLFYGKALIFIISMASMILFKTYLGLILTIVVCTSWFYIFMVLLKKKNDNNEIIYIDFALSKLKKTTTLKNYIIGLIVSCVLFVGDIIFLIYSIINFEEKAGGSGQDLLSTAVLVVMILISIIVFYLYSIIKLKKQTKNI